MKVQPFPRVTFQRRSNMRAIKATNNTTTERRLRGLLSGSGIPGWNVRPNLYGSPDFVFRREKLAIFVDGCFWHGCKRCGHLPKTNKNYWRAKISRNKKRDAAVSRTLRARGYSVVRIWECKLRGHPRSCIARVTRALLG